MSNIINLADRNPAAAERRFFNAIATDIRAGVDIQDNIDEIEVFLMYTEQPQLIAAGGALLAEYAGVRA